jgi:hypothetical protein
MAILWFASVPGLTLQQAVYCAGRLSLCAIRVAHKFRSSPTTASLTSRLNVHFLYLWGWLFTRVTL